MGETLRILLLEDVLSDAELIEIEMRQAGIQFTTLRVETEPEFRRALVDFHPDLILADYSLPSFNALEALRIVNRQSSEIPFLLVTGSQSEEIAAQVMKEGAHDYLLKSSLMRLPTAVRNVLERKVFHQAKLQAEEALRLSEARYRLLVQTQQDLVVEADMEGHLLFVNAAYCALFSKTEEELIGSDYMLLIHPDDLPLVTKSIASLSAPPYECSIEERAKTQHGWRWLSWTDKAILNDQGVVTTFVATGRDITELKEAEKALRDSEALLNEVGEIAKVGGWQLEVDTKQVIWTSETYRIHEVPEGERVNLAGALLFFDLPERSTLETALQRCMETGEGYDLELPFTSAKGKHLWTRVLGRAVRRGSNVVWLKGTFQDISDRKHLEQTMEKARADFLFAVSHELKTPLHVIGTTQEMIESLPEEQQLVQFRKYGNLWRRNLMRLRFIIENLVDGQRSTEMGLKLEKQPANLMDLVREIAEELEPVASRRSVQLRVQGGSLLLLSMDSTAIRRLLENLLINAIKFSHFGGQVEIRLRTEDEMACLDIRDFGMGIDPRIKPFLFQPFYRSPEALSAGVQGTGLGLYVSKMIAEAHGGTISLESEPDKGTTVTVQLPIQTAGS